MTLEEISREYDASADLVLDRMRLLRRMEKETSSRDERRRLYSRRMALLPLLRDCRHTARYTRNYYKGGTSRCEQ